MAGVRFGMFVPQGWRHDLVDIDQAEHWPVMKGLAQHADAGPWESIWVYDHLHTVPVPSDQATHEAWTLISAFGAVTERIRLGQMCTCMAYRNPAYLAKVAATCDHISAGRVEMGIGAGWYEHEWRAYGYGFPPARERLRMLDEGVQIMRQAWTDGVATLDGQHYQVNGAIVRPRPLQDGGIPLWIAGGGEQVTLRIAAKYAHYTNFDGTLPGFARKSELLQQHCREVGTDFDAIVRSANYNVLIGADEAEVAQRREAVRARLAPYLKPDRLDALVHMITSTSGTPEQVLEKLAGAVDAGLGYAIINFPDAAYDRSGIELFEREVIPQLA